MAPASGLGSGFALYEAGARSSALAGAVVARADDLSAIFYQPRGPRPTSGLSDHGRLLVHYSPGRNRHSSGGVDTRTLMDSQVSAVPHFFASYQVAERVWLGLGVNSPFGLGIQYNDNWPGSANVTKAAIQTLNLNPTVAVKVTDYLAAGRRPGHHVF